MNQTGGLVWGSPERALRREGRGSCVIPALKPSPAVRLKSRLLLILNEKLRFLGVKGVGRPKRLIMS
jgi:hypothetical protein